MYIGSKAVAQWQFTWASVHRALASIRNTPHLPNPPKSTHKVARVV